MKTNQKGFTLIELLAVIIILAIIALIAVPTILGIIDKSREGAAEDATYGLVSAAETYYAEYMIDNAGTAPTEITWDNVKSKVKGTAPTGTPTFAIGSNGQITVSGAVFYSKFTCSTDSSGQASCTSS